MKFGIKNKVDYVALSFVQSAEPVIKVKKILQKSGASRIKVISKIENMAGINNIDEIIRASDMIMVARGDLRIEMSKKKLSYFQEMIVDKGKRAGKPVIVATGFLESMIEKKTSPKIRD